jgi:hypothetical protein
VRLALENAVSVASVLLLTEATMTEKPLKREERSPRNRRSRDAIGYQPSSTPPSNQSQSR